MINREEYCKDCKRSIYGEYKDCDINIENDGRYTKDTICYCKVKDGGNGHISVELEDFVSDFDFIKSMAEKYKWERGE